MQSDLDDVHSRLE
jgi:chromosome segregation ATPase